MAANNFLETLQTFDGAKPIITEKLEGQLAFHQVEGEFWTSAQRQGMNLHEISYRACFKPQLPHYFISRFSEPGDLIYDPFAGRGTTLIEAASMGRRVVMNDVNPLSTYFTQPRLELPALDDIAQRLEAIPRETKRTSEIDLSMFYEKKTLTEILALQEYLERAKEDGSEDSVDRWIRMAATNRLTGHSPGFFSVYSMPPNQAVSATRQKKINEQRNQVPEYRDTHALINKKSKQLQGRLTAEQIENLRAASKTAAFFDVDAAQTSGIAAETVQLTVTSPPFLDIVQYSDDNWLRGWFNQIDMESVAAKITMSKTIEQWDAKMKTVFQELHRITKPGGFVAFEVGEVRNGKVKLEEAVVPVGGLGSHA
jgi:adenine-specific DNA methylase